MAPLFRHCNHILHPDMWLTCSISICAVTIYRIYITAIDHPGIRSSQETHNMNALIALLTSLETLLGIISACLPLLKPIANKFWNSLPTRQRNANRPSTSGSIPIMMRISQMLTVSFRGRSSGGERISSLGDSWYELQVGKFGTATAGSCWLANTESDFKDRKDAFGGSQNEG